MESIDSFSEVSAESIDRLPSLRPRYRYKPIFKPYDVFYRIEILNRSSVRIHTSKLSSRCTYTLLRTKYNRPTGTVVRDDHPLTDRFGSGHERGRHALQSHLHVADRRRPLDEIVTLFSPKRLCVSFARETSRVSYLSRIIYNIVRAVFIIKIRSALETQRTGFDYRNQP